MSELINANAARILTGEQLTAKTRQQLASLDMLIKAAAKRAENEMIYYNLTVEAINVLRKLGYVVIEGNSYNTTNGYTAGSVNTPIERLTNYTIKW